MTEIAGNGLYLLLKIQKTSTVFAKIDMKQHKNTFFFFSFTNFTSYPAFPVVQLSVHILFLSALESVCRNSVFAFCWLYFLSEIKFSYNLFLFCPSSVSAFSISLFKFLSNNPNDCRLLL